MSPGLNGSSVIRRFKHGNAIEIRNGITFDFYTGLPHMYMHTHVHTHKVSQECCTKMALMINVALISEQ